MLELLLSSIRLATPLVFASMGGLLSERAGIATICLEGAMILGAFGGAVVNFYSHSPWLGVMAGMLLGVLAFAFHALLTITCKADHIISGIAINLFASGITPLMNKVLFLSPSNSQQIPLTDRFSSVPIPFLCQIPFVGELLFNHTPLIYLSFCLPFVVHFLVNRTSWGLRLKSSGDGPHVLESLGVSYKKVRWNALLYAGAITGLGGVYLSISHASQFTRDMTAGRGYIALTALIFGKWRPLPTFFACLFFGFTDALQIQLQSAMFFNWTIPIQFIQALPYMLTLFVLIGFVGKARAPLFVGVRVD